jgi:hypothetical protein
MGNAIMQATVVSASAPQQNQELAQLALFDSSGAALAVGKKMPVQAASTAADLAALIVDFNALLTKLKNAGLMATS